MQPVQNSLYHKICDYSLDAPESSFKFSDRLARENRWSIDYARRVVAEYKRFMFLAAVAEHQVTPSEDVDEA